jgi:hypothetical protein
VALYSRLGPQCSERSFGGRKGRKLARGGMTHERWRAFRVVKKTEQSSNQNDIEGRGNVYAPTPAPSDEDLMRHQGLALVRNQAAFVVALAAAEYSGL